MPHPDRSRQARTEYTECVNGIDSTRAAVEAYWDHVASRYLELFRDELRDKPEDCALLREFAAALPAQARVCDAGCGPCGHISRLLADCGLQITGIDLSSRCIELAHSEQPGLSFSCMDMTALRFADGSFEGLVAYYALHYLPRTAHAAALQEFARVLAPGGRLLLAVKEGTNEGWIDDPMGSGQRVFWCEFTADELRALAVQAGFEVLSCTVREPLPGEIAIRRIHLVARRGMAQGRVETPVR